MKGSHHCPQVRNLTPGFMQLPLLMSAPHYLLFIAGCILFSKPCSRKRARVMGG